MRNVLFDKLRKDVTVYGPYLRKDGRKHVIIYDGKHRQTMSYPKWLKEQELGKELNKEDTIDHVNRDFTDDASTNLQVLDRSSHIKLDVIRVKLIECECVWCGESIKRTPSALRYRSKKNVAGPFCSKECSGKYGAELQNGRADKLPAQKSAQSEYYKNKKG